MAIDISRLNHTQLGELIKRAQQRQHEQEKDKAAKLREKFAKMAREEGLDLGDVVGRGKARKTRAKVKPKYRNPANRSETWSGRGKRPRWFVAALAMGKKEKDLLIG